jgi:hypothetical protein
MSEQIQFQNFQEFYKFYLSEHCDRTCRRLHFVGSTGGLICLAAFLFTFKWYLIPLGLFIGYGCAWIGHFFFEHNKPASFKYPLYSFAGDWVMFKDILIGKIRF